MSILGNVSNISRFSLSDGEPALKKRRLSNEKEETVSEISNQSLSSSSKTALDRFLPNRQAMNEARIGAAYFLKPPETLYQQALMETIIPCYSSRTLLNRSPAPFQISRELAPVWQIPKNPFRVFNAEAGGEVSSDFYNRPLDWGRSVYFAVESVVWAVDLLKGQSNELMSLDDDVVINSIKSSPSLDEIAIGSRDSRLFLFDMKSQQISVSYKVDLLQERRATCIAWKKEETELTVGLSGSIVHFDKRQKSKVWEVSLESEGHTCSVDWNRSDLFLGTGNNANMLKVFDARLMEASQPIYELTTQAAIKALQWNPINPRLLAMGSGVADKHLYLIDLNEKKSVYKENLGFQICDLTWLDQEHFMTGAGYGSTTSEGLSVWRYRKATQALKKVGMMSNGREGRILNLVKEPSKSQMSARICSHWSDSDGSNQTVSVWELKNIEQLCESEKKKERRSSRMKSWDIR